MKLINESLLFGKPLPEIQILKEEEKPIEGVDNVSLMGDSGGFEPLVFKPKEEENTEN